MSDHLCPGDLITGRPIVDDTLLYDNPCNAVFAKVNSLASLMARPAGTLYWTLQVPRHSIMTVVESHSADPSADRHFTRVVTALHDDQLIELFLADVQRVDWAQGPPLKHLWGPPQKCGRAPHKKWGPRPPALAYSVALPGRGLAKPLLTKIFREIFSTFSPSTSAPPEAQSPEKFPEKNFHFF